MPKLYALILMSILLLYVSRSMFRNMRSHALPRCLLWESILGLVLYNLDFWFVDPSTTLQLASWLLLILSIITAILGFTTLIRIGKPQGSVENTTQLVCSGIYQYIRHPLYASLLFLAGGAYLKHISPQADMLLFLAILFAIQTAKVEEKENKERFGEAYIKYMQTTKRFLPYFY